MASSSQSTSTFRPERTLIGFAIVVAMLFALMALTGTWTPRLGLDLRGGTTITLTARTSDGSTVPRENLETARNIIQNRVDSLGVGESSVTIQGNDKIEVAVPASQTEKISIRINPSQKLGMVEPSRTPPIMALSGHLSRFSAATTPKATPTTDENNSASPPKRSECGRACRIRSATGRRATIAVPRSPCITRPNQMPYCTAKG